MRLWPFMEVVTAVGLMQTEIYIFYRMHYVVLGGGRKKGFFVL